MRVLKLDSENVQHIGDKDKDHLVAFVGVEDLTVVKSKNLTLVVNLNDPNIVDGLLNVIKELGDTLE